MGRYLDIAHAIEHYEINGKSPARSDTSISCAIVLNNVDDGIKAVR